MDEGKEALPSSDAKDRLCTPLKIWDMHNPFPRKGDTLGSTFFNIVVLPISIPFACISMPTEVLYCFLDIILPKRGMPWRLQQVYEATK